MMGIGSDESNDTGDKPKDKLKEKTIDEIFTLSGESDEVQDFVADTQKIITKVAVKESYQSLSVEDRKAVQTYVGNLIDHFIRHKNEIFVGNRSSDAEEDDDNLIGSEEEKNILMKKVDYQIKEKGIPLRLADIVREQFIRFRWGYYIIDPLIEDLDISDIKIYGYNKITVKKPHKRLKTDIQFLDKREYRDFVSLIAIKNGMGQSNNNAIIKFTDTDTSKDFRLRFDVLTKYVTSGKESIIHIRKTPKVKRDFADLATRKMFPPGVEKYIKEHVADGDGMLVTGKNGSGKTTLLNAIIDEIDEQKAVMVIEDNQELFSDKREEIMFTHSVETKAEGKITYSLSDLAEEGLLCDIDVMFVGEIKNDSAKGLMKAAYVGVQCFTTSHGQSAIDGYYKLADYVKQATTYDLDDCLRFLVGFKTLIFMKDYRVRQIVENRGWDEDTKKPIFKLVYDEFDGGWHND